MTESRSNGSGAWVPPGVEELQALLPQYEIDSILGHGGMGAVYRGRQTTLDRPVAIKVLPEFVTQGDDEMNLVERFRLEARAMANLDHPAIVSVHDFGQTDAGQLYFIMEFIDGMDVEQYIASNGGKVDPVHAVAIVSHVLDALAYAHSKGIVHRDIKPANILINQEGRVKIADFGLVKQFAGENAAQLSALTLDNVAMGTPDYIAPEALELGTTPDHRADLYAVGVMLYKMLTGKLPRGLFKMPSEESSDLDPRFDDIIALAIESTPEARFQSAFAFREKLDELQSRPIERIEPELASGDVVPVLTRPSPVNDTNQAGQRHKEEKQQNPVKRSWVAWGVLAVLSLSGFIAFTLFNDKDTPPDSPDSVSALPSQVAPETTPSTTGGDAAESLVVSGTKQIGPWQFHTWTGDKVELQLLDPDWTIEIMGPIVSELDRFQRHVEEMTGFDLSGNAHERVEIYEMEGAKAGVIFVMGPNSRTGLSKVVSEGQLTQYQEKSTIPLGYIHHSLGRIWFDLSKKLDFPHEMKSSHATLSLTDIVKRIGLEETGIKVGMNQPVSLIKSNTERILPIFDQSKTTWEEAMTSGKFEAGDQSFPIRMAYSYLLMSLIEETGREEFLKNFFAAAQNLQETKSHQDAIDNFYLAARAAAGNKVDELLIERFRMPVSDGIR